VQDAFKKGSKSVPNSGPAGTTIATQLKLHTLPDIAIDDGGMLLPGPDPLHNDSLFLKSP
jgi:hypothetical protein